MNQNVSSRTRKLVILSLMIAITIIMAYTPLGIIPLQPISATIIHIPAILTALLLGPACGVTVGAAFGIVTLIKAATAPAGILDPFFINPLVSLVPRVIFPIIAYYSYVSIKTLTRKELPGVILGTAVGSGVHTLCVMLMLYICYAQPLAEAVGSPALALIWSIISTYGVMEMLAACVICTPLVFALRKVYHF